jgi:excisionase family DNA binding protein
MMKPQRERFIETTWREARAPRRRNRRDRAPSNLRGLLAAGDDVLADTPPHAIPELLGQLEHLRALLWARLLCPTERSVPRTNDLAAEAALLDVAAAAETLRVSSTTIRRLEVRGILPGVRIGRRLLFRPDALARFAEGQERHRDL